MQQSQSTPTLDQYDAVLNALIVKREALGPERLDPALEALIDRILARRKSLLSTTY